jgi:uncharacterized protein (TIGR02284 family)
MTQIETLKTLAQETYDTLAGYRKAHETADSSALRQTLERRIAERTRTMNMLNDALESHGEQTVDDASATTQGQQLLQSIRDAFADKDEAAVERIEAIESDLSERYADALRNDDMDASVRMAITNAAREVREGERFSKVLERHYA